MKGEIALQIAIATLTVQCWPLHSQMRVQEPTEVKVGLYIQQIDNVNVKTETFDCEFYFYLTWKGPYSPQHYEFVNGNITHSTYDVEDIDSAGVHIISAKLRGTFQDSLDVSDYPMDKHMLTIELEDFDWPEDSLKYTVDAGNTGIALGLSLSEWKLTNVGTSVTSAFFKPSRTSFSHYKFSVGIQRSLTPFIIKIFIPLIIVVAMSMLTFFLPADELEAQTSLGATSLLSIIAFHFLISGQLPDVGYLTKADTLMIGSYVFILSSLVETVVVNRHFKRGNKIVSQRIDRVCRWLFPLLYCLFIIALWFV